MTVDHKGKPTTNYLRDSSTVVRTPDAQGNSSKPLGKDSTTTTGVAPPSERVTLGEACTALNIRPLPTLAEDRADAKRAERRKRKADDTDRTSTLIQSISSTAAHQPSDAATRMAAIRARVSRL